MRTYIAICNAAIFGSGKEDINGFMPVILNPVFGTVPNRRTISGTIAQSLGIDSGNTYLLQFTEVEANEYGVQFRVTKLGDVSAMDIAIKRKELLQNMGAAKVEDVNAPVEAPKAVEAEEPTEAETPFTN